MSGKLLVSKKTNPLTLSLPKGRPEPFDAAQDMLVEGRPDLFNELLSPARGFVSGGSDDAH